MKVYENNSQLSFITIHSWYFYYTECFKRKVSENTKHHGKNEDLVTMYKHKRLAMTSYYGRVHRQVSLSKAARQKTKNVIFCKNEMFCDKRVLLVLALAFSQKYEWEVFDMP